MANVSRQLMAAVVGLAQKALANLATVHLVDPQGLMIVVVVVVVVVVVAVAASVIVVVVLIAFCHVLYAALSLKRSPPAGSPR